MTANGMMACYKVFQDGQCNKECDTEHCLLDGFDCKTGGYQKCWNSSYCCSRFSNARCDRKCNTDGCLWDGLDCAADEPDYADGTLVLILVVPPKTFLNGSHQFMYKLSQVLRIVAMIKNDVNNKPMVLKYDFPTSRKRRALSDGPLRYRRTSSSGGTALHVKLDKRGCSGECLQDANMAANVLGATTASQKLDLSYDVFSAKSEPDNTPTTPPTLTSPKPLWTAILYVGIPLFVVGVLVGGRRVCAKVWFPEGFSQRRGQPVSQEVSMKSFRKKSETDETDFSSI